MNSEVSKFYEDRMYGKFRSGEDITYVIADGEKEGEKLLSITLEKDNRAGKMDVKVYLPEKNDLFKKGNPVLICMHPIEPIPYALSEGYGVMIVNSYQVASDNTEHKGCFYDLYPYGDDPDSQTGVLMAWGWGTSKVLDALYAGAGEALGFDPDASIVTGVSRWGKATAVAGAFDKRFRMVMPACSGAGGLALYNVFSEGKTYDLSAVGAPSDYTYDKNEPLSCLQSDGERGWFCDRFLEFKSPQEIPMDQENLLELGLSKERLYLVVASYTGEDWVNAPSMWECFKRALFLATGEGLSENVGVSFHKVGHAVLKSDLEIMIPWFNYFVYGAGEKPDMVKLHTTVFD